MPIVPLWPDMEIVQPPFFPSTMHMPPGPSTVWQRVQDPSWNTFRETWWNARPQLESMIQAKAIPFGSSDVVNEFSSGSNAFGPSLDTLYVRNELVEVYARIQNIFDNKAAPGVILTGQPGCGKTISLIFFLVCQLATGRPVMYTKAQRTTYYFNGDGIWKAKLVDLESRDIPEGPVWSLIDSNEGPPDAITRFAFPIHAASLDESKYNNWRKEMFPPMLFLNPWSMEDLVGWAQVEPRMRHLGLNYQQLCNLVDVCGPVPRDIARELAGVSPAAQVSAKLVSQLTAAEFLKQLGEFTTSPSPASDKLFLVRGHINDCSEDTCTTDFKSLHVAQRVYDKWRILNEDEALLIYNFCQQVNAKVATSPAGRSRASPSAT
ncbi:hypothetical protein C8J57DRAFT_597358 [Mycena rebaudengoi]|nr:hypothetical protein C8J57DRAFT_597358 [Mycena rebaudengoi]